VNGQEVTRGAKWVTYSLDNAKSDLDELHTAMNLYGVPIDTDDEYKNYCMLKVKLENCVHNIGECAEPCPAQAYDHNAPDSTKGLVATPGGYSRFINRSIDITTMGENPGILINRRDKTKNQDVHGGSWRETHSTIAKCFEKCNEQPSCRGIALRSEVKSGKRVRNYYCQFLARHVPMDNTKNFAEFRDGKFRDIYNKD
jgi:hypothetical protein